MPTTIRRDDPRFSTLSRGWNSRFPAAEEDRAAQVDYCANADDVLRSLQAALDAGVRPTIRSSGHCYEDFIANNPGGLILDVSMMDRVEVGPTPGSFVIEPGAKLGNVYERLYKLGNAVIPGGTCFTVTAGGHISGGGYGTLARMYGLTVDWVTGVDIVVVNHAGKAELLRTDAHTHPELFRALRGGQGSNFGVITAFHFAKLPPMPVQVLTANISFDWNGMTLERFQTIVLTYGRYWEAQDGNPATRPLFTELIISSRSSGRVTIGVQFAQTKGGDEGLDVVEDFLNRFQTCQPVVEMPSGYDPEARPRGPMVGDSVCYGQHPLRRLNWVDNTVSDQGGSSFPGASRRRAKYKSCYMKKAFTADEAKVLYEQMSSDATRGLILAIDAYGGAVNDPARRADTAMSQRSSIMKMQYMSYWVSEAEDAFRLNGIRQCYTAMYSTANADARYKGTPYPNAMYDGCYMNYADADMAEHAWWPQLFYGTGDVYPLLQRVKKQWDPHNIFHHAMSVRPA